MLSCVLARVHKRKENIYNVYLSTLSVTCSYVVTGSVPLFIVGSGNPILMRHALAAPHLNFTSDHRAQKTSVFS